jgi:hypothetical protein
MRISVYLKQDELPLASAPHETSKRIALRLLSLSVARPIGKNAIQLTENITWREAKNLVRRRPIEMEMGLLPPLDWYFPWTDLPLWLIQVYRQHRMAA